MNSVEIKKNGTIPKSLLSTQDLHKLKDSLTLKDSRSINNGSRIMTCYSETSEYLEIPKHYCIGYAEEKGLNIIYNQSCGSNTLDISFKGSLREHQVDIVTKTLQSIRSVEGAVLSVPCGFGKTALALYISTQLKKKTLILVHTSALFDQWKERVSSFVNSASIGTIRGPVFDIDGKTHVIAFIQSIVSRIYDVEQLSTFGFLIVDEAHHLGARTLSTSISKIGCKYRLGLSATTDRKDGCTDFLFWSLGPLLTNKIVTSHPDMRVFNIHLKNGPSEMVWLHRYGKKEIHFSRMISNLCEQTEKSTFRTSVIVNWISRCYRVNRKIIVLSDRTKLLLDIQDSLIRSVDVPIDARTIFFMTGSTKNREVPSNYRIILTTYALTSEGFDQPDLDTLVMASPRSDIIQSVGRILRVHPNKRTPLIIDMIDCSFPFHNLHHKRTKYYKELDAQLLQYNENCVLIEQEVDDKGAFTFKKQRIR